MIVKRIHLAATAVLILLAAGMARGEDMDVRALKARLEAQEAHLRELEAKQVGQVGGNASAADPSRGPAAPEDVLSLNPRATVKIGGTVGTRYYYGDYEVEKR